MTAGTAPPVARARGLGGELLLHRDRLEIRRSGPLFTLLALAFGTERELDTVILLRELTGVHVVRSLLLIEFVRFSYAGCPHPTGRYLRDATAENALLLGVLDNRDVAALLRRLAALVGGGRD